MPSERGDLRGEAQKSARVPGNGVTDGGATGSGRRPNGTSNSAGHRCHRPPREDERPLANRRRPKVLVSGGSTNSEHRKA
jgi:hypothetical protein